MLAARAMCVCNSFLFRRRESSRPQPFTRIVIIVIRTRDVRVLAALSFYDKNFLSSTAHFSSTARLSWFGRLSSSLTTCPNWGELDEFCDAELYVIQHCFLSLFADSNTSGHFTFFLDQFMIHTDTKDWWVHLNRFLLAHSHPHISLRVLGILISFHLHRHHQWFNMSLLHSTQLDLLHRIELRVDSICLDALGKGHLSAHHHPLAALHLDGGENTLEG